MHCPNCLEIDTKVIDSRISPDGLKTRRRRKCESCDFRFTTYEEAQINLPMVVKSDQRREAFSYEKLEKGINKACQKRPITTEQVKDILNRVQREVLELSHDEVTTKAIGEIATRLLAKLDPVAYIRFASVYWDYNDINGFISSLEKNHPIVEGLTQ